MGGKTPSTAAANKLAGISERMFNQSNPSRRAMFSQLGEALKTGGIGARIPIIQRAVADVNESTRVGLGHTQEQLSRAGVTGPFAQQILAQQRMAGSQQAARIPTDIAGQMINAGPGLISAGSGIPGLAAAANIQGNAAMQGSANQAGIYGAAGQAGGTIAGALLSRGSSGSTAAADRAANDALWKSAGG